MSDDTFRNHMLNIKELRILLSVPFTSSGFPLFRRGGNKKKGISNRGEKREEEDEKGNRGKEGEKRNRGEIKEERGKEGNKKRGKDEEREEGNKREVKRRRRNI